MASRSFHVFLLIALSITSGCTIEARSNDPFQPVSGEVTYQGVPLKKGAINLIPVDNTGVSATGDIVDGVIKNMTSRAQGDGAKVGTYRVTIIAIDEAYANAHESRDSAGPTTESIAELISKVKSLIPSRYANAKTSGLTAEISSGSNFLRFHLEPEVSSEGANPKAEESR